MSELQDVLRAIEEGAAGGEPMALATIVDVRGSTYRREGARLLIPASGRTVGTISGGCLEGDVQTVAEEVMGDGVPRLAHYDLTADDEAVWGWGLGCNGVIDVFVEPADRAAEMAGAIRQAIDDQRELAAVTLVEVDDGSADAGPPGTRALVHGDGRVEGSLGSPELDARASSEGLDALARERSGLVTLAPGIMAFVEALLPPPRLVLCGAGHDAIPLVAVASSLGWSVVVVDDRQAFMTVDRFPGASRLVVSPPERASEAVGTDRRTYPVVMSHNFLRDKDYLRSFLGSPAPYIGMLGPHARFGRLVDELRREGAELREEDLAVVHSPAGLDVGAEGPEEIAWAIAGEVLALRNGRAGGFLKDRPGPIHGREPTAPLSASR